MDKDRPARADGVVRALIPQWLRSSRRREMLRAAVEHGKADTRVAFCVLVDLDSRMVVDVLVCPPPVVDQVCERLSDGLGLRLMALDFHVEQLQAETREEQASIGRHCERIVAGWLMVGELIPSFLHARRYAYRAGVKGTVWGTELDLPPELRNDDDGGEE